MTERLDTQQEKVYAAEARVPTGHQFLDAESAQAWVDDIVASDYWQQRVGWGGSLWPVVVTDRGGRHEHARGGWTDKGYEILLPRWAWSEAVVIHELSHVLCYARLDPEWKFEGHGVEFAAESVLLTEYVRGVDARNALLRAYDEAGVKLMPPEGVLPCECEPFVGLAVDRIGGAIAL